MNGKSNIDPINPCSREKDKRTYGLRWLCFSTYGKRLVWCRIGPLTIDVYRGGVVGRRCFFARMQNAATWFTPIGSFTWPMPKLDDLDAANDRLKQIHELSEAK